MTRRHYATLAVVLLVLALAWWSGIVADTFNADRIRELVVNAGAWGPVVYIAVAAASFVVFLLAPVVWVSVALWPVPWAFAYSFAAALGASVLTYALTFSLGREWARSRVPAKLSQWEERLAARPIAAIVTMRFFLWANPFVDMFAAVSRVPTRAYLAGTVLGLLWPTAFQVGLGAGGGALFSSVTASLFP